MFNSGIISEMPKKKTFSYNIIEVISENASVDPSEWVAKAMKNL